MSDCGTISARTNAVSAVVGLARTSITKVTRRVYKTGATWENGAAVIHNAVIQDHLKMGDSFSVGFIYLDGARDADAMGRKIEAEVPGMRVTLASEVTKHFSDQLQYIDWFVWIVSLVSVIVGGLGVLNTMIMSVVERTREIGTLRAVGWSRAMVLQLIMSEGFIISIIGGAVGMLFGVLGSEIIIQFAPQGFIHTVYHPELFLKAGIVALILGFLGSLYPAWQASRLSPIEALKYE